MLTNVAKAGAAKQSVGQGMQKHIAVRVGQYFWRVGNAHAAKTHGAALTVTVNIVAHARADGRKGIFVLQQVQIFRTGNLHVGSLALYDAYLKAKGLQKRCIVGYGKPRLNRVGVGREQRFKLKSPAGSAQPQARRAAGWPLRGHFPPS